jgi:hypothetical protein
VRVGERRLAAGGCWSVVTSTPQPAPVLADMTFLAGIRLVKAP